VQHEAGLVAFLDKIFEARLAVLGNDPGSLFSSFRHGAVVAGRPAIGPYVLVCGFGARLYPLEMKALDDS
jgi:hypothetical protein